jgi:hypothetical protein
MLVAMAMTVVVGSLWLTEPNLPSRTVLAFAVMVTIGILWMLYAVWVLTSRRVLFARQRVIAGWMAVSFTTVFLVGAISVGVTTGMRAAYPAGATAAIMLGAAIALLIKAQRNHARLARRLAALQGERTGRPA